MGRMAPAPGASQRPGGAVTQYELGATTMEITTVGLDLAKNVFQVHAIGDTGEVVVRRALRRAQVIPFCDPVLQQASTVPDRYGSLRHGAITGRESWSVLATRFD